MYVCMYVYIYTYIYIYIYIYVYDLQAMRSSNNLIRQHDNLSSYCFNKLLHMCCLLNCRWDASDACDLGGPLLAPDFKRPHRCDII